VVQLVYFSIIIYAYDRKEYITRAVRSAVRQDFDRSNFEIVVVKGFTDPEIDAEFQAIGVKNVFLAEKSLGKKVAKGIRESNGEFFCLLDDDDEFEPNKLSTLRKIISNVPDVDFIHNSLIKMNEEGKITGTDSPENTKKVISYCPSSDKASRISKIIRHRGDWYLSAMTLRKSVTDSMIDALDETDQSIDKFIFFSALNYARRMLIIPDKLTRYRMHRSTTTYNGGISDFIARRTLFFKNTVRVFSNIAGKSKGLPGEKFAECQLIQHRINLYFISNEPSTRVKESEFLSYLGCLKFARSRYQLIWVCAYLLRKISSRLSRIIYYKFMMRIFATIIDT